MMPMLDKLRSGEALYYGGGYLFRSRLGQVKSGLTRARNQMFGVGDEISSTWFGRSGPP